MLWGEPGTNGQHSFHQLLHQGTAIVPCDFIVLRESLNPIGEHHTLLVANALAQAEALAFGRTADEVRAAGVPEQLVPHRTFPGNRPSSTLLLDRLTPFSLGSLVGALRAQRAHAGRDLGNRLLRPVGCGARQDARRADRAGAGRTAEEPEHDSSTNELIRRYRAGRSS